jgi:hypothetical protein
MNRLNGQVLNRGITIVAGTVLVATLMMITASKVNAVDPNFEIKKFGIDQNGDPFLTVEGTAGGTKPTEPNQVFAYVFDTDNGIFAVASHKFEDSTEVKNDLNWHAHKIKLDSNKCITSLKEQGDALLKGDKVSVENIDQVSKVKDAFAVELEKADGKVCVKNSLP